MTANEAIREAIDTYLNSNDYLPEKLKAQLTDWAHLDRNVLVKEGLEEAIKNSTISPLQLEGLTNSAADTQEDVDQFLKSLWAYVYEDGPEPELG